MTGIVPIPLGEVAQHISDTFGTCCQVGLSVLDVKG